VQGTDTTNASEPPLPRVDVSIKPKKFNYNDLVDKVTHAEGWEMTLLQ